MIVYEAVFLDWRDKTNYGLFSTLEDAKAQCQKQCNIEALQWTMDEYGTWIGTAYKGEIRYAVIPKEVKWPKLSV